MAIHKIITAAVLAVFLTTPAHALDGNKLHGNYCSSKDPYAKGTCDGYIVGVVEGSGMFIEGEEFCIPENVLLQQIIDVGKKYLANHPERRHEPASILIVDALISSFPCK